MSKADAADHVRGGAAGEGDGGAPGGRRGVMAVPVLGGREPPPGSGGRGDAPPARARAAVHLPARAARRGKRGPPIGDGADPRRRLAEGPSLPLWLPQIGSAPDSWGNGEQAETGDGSEGRGVRLSILGQWEFSPKFSSFFPEMLLVRVE